MILEYSAQKHNMCSDIVKIHEILLCHESCVRTKLTDQLSKVAAGQYSLCMLCFVHKKLCYLLCHPKMENPGQKYLLLITDKYDNRVMSAYSKPASFNAVERQQHKKKKKKVSFSIQPSFTEGDL